MDFVVLFFFSFLRYLLFCFVCLFVCINIYLSESCNSYLALSFVVYQI